MDTAIRQGATTGASEVEREFFFERLREDIDLLGATVQSLKAARVDRSPESVHAVLHARLEVTSEAVVDEFMRLWPQPAERTDTRSRQNPAEEGGLLVQ